MYFHNNETLKDSNELLMELYFLFLEYKYAEKERDEHANRPISTILLESIQKDLNEASVRYHKKRNEIIERYSFFTFSTLRNEKEIPAEIRGITVGVTTDYYGYSSEELAEIIPDSYREFLLKKNQANDLQGDEKLMFEFMENVHDFDTSDIYKLEDSLSDLQALTQGLQIESELPLDRTRLYDDAGRFNMPLSYSVLKPVIDKYMDAIISKVSTLYLFLAIRMNYITQRMNNRASDLEKTQSSLRRPFLFGNSAKANRLQELMAEERQMDLADEEDYRELQGIRTKLLSTYESYVVSPFSQGTNVSQSADDSHWNSGENSVNAINCDIDTFRQMHEEIMILVEEASQFAAFYNKHVRNCLRFIRNEKQYEEKRNKALTLLETKRNARDMELDSAKETIMAFPEERYSNEKRRLEQAKEKQVLEANASFEEKNAELRNSFKSLLELAETNRIECCDSSFSFTLEEKPSILSETDSHKIAVGQFFQSASVQSVFNEWIKDCTQKMQERASAYINAYYMLKIQPGSVVKIDYSDSDEDVLLSFIRTIEGNAIRYCSDILSGIDHIDPLRMDDNALGFLKPLASMDNSLVSHVPRSAEQIKNTLQSIVDEGRNYHTESGHVRIVVLHSLSKIRDSQSIALIQQMIRNAKDYGLMIILTDRTNDNSQYLNSAYSEIDEAVKRFMPPMGVRGIMLRFTGIAKYVVVRPDQCAEGDEIGPELSPVYVRNSSDAALPADLISAATIERETIDNSYEQLIGFNVSEYQKGERQLTGIPYGIDAEGKVFTLDFENTNFATFISGASRSGKSTLLHTLLTGLLEKYHPDDIEIWLIDFKMTEFSRYIKHLPPHVRYILLDESPELVYDLLDRLYEIMIKRQNLFKGRWQKLSDVPESKYMPAMFIMIDEFSVMSQIVAESALKGKEDYRVKLQMLLARGAALGMHFVFSSQGFTSGSTGLNEFAKKQIQQRISMKTEYDEIRATLDLKTTSETDRAMMEGLEVHHALMRVPEDALGNHLLLSKVIYIKDYRKQEKMIDDIRKKMVPEDRFSPEDPSKYVNKHPLIVDGENYHAFNDYKQLMEENIQKIYTDETCIIYPGEPRRMMSVFPVEMSNSFGENVLIVGQVSENAPMASIVASLGESLAMQGKKIKIWTLPNHSVSKELRKCSFGKTIRMFSGIEEVSRDILATDKELKNGSSENTVIVILGLESMINDLNKSSASSEPSGSFIMPHSSSGANLLALLDEELGKISAEKADADEDAVTNKYDSYDADDISSDKRNAGTVLSELLAQAPKKGCHFVLVFRNYQEFIQVKLDSSLFRHKLLFSMPKQDLSMLVGHSGSDLSAGLTGHTFRYYNGIESVSFKPFLHSGLTWDGWMIDDNGEAVIDRSEDELLL